MCDSLTVARPGFAVRNRAPNPTEARPAAVVTRAWTPPRGVPAYPGREGRELSWGPPRSRRALAMASRAASLIFSWSRAKRMVASTRPIWVPQSKRVPRNR